MRPWEQVFLLSSVIRGVFTTLSAREPLQADTVTSHSDSLSRSASLWGGRGGVLSSVEKTPALGVALSHQGGHPGPCSRRGLDRAGSGGIQGANFPPSFSEQLQWLNFSRQVGGVCVGKDELGEVLPCWWGD